ncbi:hypothetical protein ACFL21_01465 [Patescibacteria group bacterium]
MKKRLFTQEAQEFVEKEELSRKSRKQIKKDQILVSKVCSNGIIIETIYKPEEEETYFAVFKNGEVEYKSKISLDSNYYRPICPESDYIKWKAILFPSEAKNYESLAKLLKEIQKFIHKYVQVSQFYEILVSYYVLLTWIYDRFPEIAYLRALGDYGTGKSRFLYTVGSICYKPMFMNGATSVSPIFRIINEIRGTLILDEADYKFSDTTQEITKILNCGFSKGMPVWRSESINNQHKPKAFNVYGPKILAGRAPFQDIALESRCLVEKMDRRTRKDIPINLNDEFWQEAEEIRNKCLMFRFKNYFNLNENTAEVDESLEPRLNQIIIPLLSIIEDEKDKKEILEFIKKYNEDLAKDRTYSIDADIVDALVQALETDSSPTMQMITNIFNNQTDIEENIKPRKMGELIRKKLNLDTNKFRDGYRIVNSPINIERINNLKKRFGITNCEHVNIVNVAEEGERDLQQAMEAFDVSEDAVSDT